MHVSIGRRLLEGAGRGCEDEDRGGGGPAPRPGLSALRPRGRAAQHHTQNQQGRASQVTLANCMYVCMYVGMYVCKDGSV